MPVPYYFQCPRCPHRAAACPGCGGVERAGQLLALHEALCHAEAVIDWTAV